MFTRRNFLHVGLAGVALSVIPGVSRAAGKALPKVAVQLYSVRELCKVDLAGTLKAIHEMGYVGVELAGSYGKPAAEWTALLQANHLIANGTHTGIDTIKPDKLDKTIAEYKAIGCTYLTVPWLNADTVEKWNDYAKIFNAAVAKVKAAGMVLSYHNHQHEFREKINGTRKWEIFCNALSPEVCLQFDVGHIVSAGEDPVYWLKKYPHRIPTIHAKEIYPGPGVLGKVPAGKVGVNWEEVFKTTDADTTQWYVVESEADPKSLENIKGCVDFLKAKGRA